MLIALCSLETFGGIAKHLQAKTVAKLQAKYPQEAKLFSAKNLIRLLTARLKKQGVYNHSLYNCVVEVVQEVLGDLELDDQGSYNQYTDPLMLGKYVLENTKDHLTVSLGFYTGNPDLTENTPLQDILVLVRTSFEEFFAALVPEEYVSSTSILKHSVGKGVDPTMAIQVTFEKPMYDFIFPVLLLSLLREGFSIYGYLAWFFSLTPYSKDRIAVVLDPVTGTTVFSKLFLKQAVSWNDSQLKSLLFGKKGFFEFWCYLAVAALQNPTSHADQVLQRLAGILKPWCEDYDRFTRLHLFVYEVSNSQMLAEWLYKQHLFTILVALMYGMETERDKGGDTDLKTALGTYMGSYPKEVLALLKEHQHDQSPKVLQFLLGVLYTSTSSSLHERPSYLAPTLKLLCSRITLNDFNDDDLAYIVCLYLDKLMSRSKKSVVKEGITPFLTIPGFKEAFQTFPKGAPAPLVKHLSPQYSHWIAIFPQLRRGEPIP